MKETRVARTKKRTNDDIADELTRDVENATRDLSDEDYIEVLETVSSNLDSSVEAKRQEQRSKR